MNEMNEMKVVQLLFVIFIYVILAYQWWTERKSRIFYSNCLIILTCVVIIVSNNLARGDSWFGPLIMLGATAGVGNWLIQTRFMKAG